MTSSMLSNMSENNAQLLQMLNARMTMMEEICHSVPCDETPFARFVMGPVYFVLFALAFAGNVCNVAIYQSSCFRSSIAVRMLTFKAIANMLFIACHLPKAIYNIAPSVHTLHVWSVRLQPFTLFASNLFGTLAIWLTVLIIVERYVMIVCPAWYRTFCEKRDGSMYRVYLVLVGLVVFSALLHGVHLVNRDIHEITCPEDGYLGDETEYHVVRIATHLGVWNIRLETMYNWLNLVGVLVLPLVLMMYFSIAVILQFINRRGVLERSQSQMKHCVTQLTLWTMIIHVVLDAPSTVLYTTAAVWGMQYMHESAAMCYYKTFCHFAGFLEAAVPFYIYFSFSDRFRDVFYFVVLCRPPSRALQLQRTETFKSKALLTQATSARFSSSQNINGSGTNIDTRSSTPNEDRITKFRIKTRKNKLTKHGSSKSTSATRMGVRTACRMQNAHSTDILLHLLSSGKRERAGGAVIETRDVQLYWNNEEDATSV